MMVNRAGYVSSLPAGGSGFTAARRNANKQAQQRSWHLGGISTVRHGCLKPRQNVHDADGGRLYPAIGNARYM